MRLAAGCLAVVVSSVWACGPSLARDAGFVDAADAASRDVAPTPDVPAVDVPALDAPSVETGVDAASDVPADHAPSMVTVQFQSGVAPTAAYDGTRDAYLTEIAPTTNYGTSAVLWADGDVPAGSHATRASVIAWDVSAIPAGSTVRSASVSFTVATVASAGSTDTFLVYGLVRAWSELEVTWDLASAGMPWGVAGAESLDSDRTVRDVGSVAPTASGAVTTALTAAGVAQVQRWVDDATSNHGLLLANPTSNDGLAVVSHEGTPATARPRLTVAYLSP